MIKIIFLISKIILNVAEILKVILEILQNMNLFWKEQAPIQPSFKPLSKSGSHDADVRHFRYWPISEVSSRVRIFEFDFVHYCAEDQSSDLRHGLGFPHVRSTYQSICRMRADTFRLKKEGWIGEKQWNNKEILWYERRIFTGKSDLDSHSFFSLTQIFFKKPRTNSKHILSEIGIELANLENGGSETMKSKLIFLILKLILMFVEIVKAIVEMIK